MEKGLELPPGLGLGRGEPKDNLGMCPVAPLRGWDAAGHIHGWRSGRGRTLHRDGGKARWDLPVSRRGFFPSLFHAGVPFSLSSRWFHGENFPRSPWLELGRWESPGGSGRFPVEQRCSKGPADEIPAVPEVPGDPLLKPGSFGEEGNATTGI